MRDIAATVGVTERRAHDMVTDLVDAGYVSKDKRTMGELLDLLGADTR